MGSYFESDQSKKLGAIYSQYKRMFFYLDENGYQHPLLKPNGEQYFIEPNLTKEAEVCNKQLLDIIEANKGVQIIEQIVVCLPE